MIMLLSDTFYTTKKVFFWVNWINFNFMGAEIVILLLKFWLLKKLPKSNMLIKYSVFYQFW